MGILQAYCVWVGDQAGLPALLCLPCPAPQITDKDAEVLSYCSDVRCERFHGEDDEEEVRWAGWACGAEVDVASTACLAPGWGDLQASLGSAAAGVCNVDPQLVSSATRFLPQPQCPCPPHPPTHHTPLPPTRPPALQGFRLVFDFRENPFFTNKQLVKTYHLSEEDDMMLSKIESERRRWRRRHRLAVVWGQAHGLPPGSWIALLPHLPSALCSPAALPPPAAASGVSWKASKDVTVKVMKKKAKPGGWVGWLGAKHPCPAVPAVALAVPAVHLQQSAHRALSTSAPCPTACALLPLLPPPAGQKGGGKPQTKTEPVESFFRWFTEVPEVRGRVGMGGWGWPGGWCGVEGGPRWSSPPACPADLPSR